MSDSYHPRNGPIVAASSHGESTGTVQVSASGSTSGKSHGLGGEIGVREQGHAGAGGLAGRVEAAVGFAGGRGVLLQALEVVAAGLLPEQALLVVAELDCLKGQVGDGEGAAQIDRRAVDEVGRVEAGVGALVLVERPRGGGRRALEVGLAGGGEGRGLRRRGRPGRLREEEREQDDRGHRSSYLKYVKSSIG